MAMRVKKDRRAELEYRIHREGIRRLRKVGELVRGRVVERISIPTRAAGPSLPGTPPHADTGKLRQSISYRTDERNLTVTIGTPLAYGKFLEEGTSKMDPRPYLKSTVEELLPQIKRILTEPIK